MGGASRWTSPLREQNLLWPPFGGPPRPAIHMADFPRPMGRTPIKRIQIL